MHRDLSTGPTDEDEELLEGRSGPRMTIHPARIVLVVLLVLVIEERPIEDEDEDEHEEEISSASLSASGLQRLDELAGGLNVAQPLVPRLPLDRQKA